MADTLSAAYKGGRSDMCVLYPVCSYIGHGAQWSVQSTIRLTNTGYRNLLPMLHVHGKTSCILLLQGG